MRYRPSAARQQRLLTHNQRIELPVLDGGSIDGTLQIICRHEPCISFFRSGPDDARQPRSMRAGSGAEARYALAPAGSSLEPGALARAFEEFTGDPDLEAPSCGTRYVTVDERGSARVKRRSSTRRRPRLRWTTCCAIRSRPGASFVAASTSASAATAASARSAMTFPVRVCLAKVKDKVRPDWRTLIACTAFEYVGRQPRDDDGHDAEQPAAFGEVPRRSEIDTSDRRALCG